MSLTLIDNGTEPIAVIDSPGEYKCVYLDLEEPEQTEEKAPSILHQRFNEESISQLVMSLKTGMTLGEVVEVLDEPPPTPPTTTHIELKGTPFKAIPLPSEKPERVIIGGRSGSGKTTKAKDYGMEYHVMYPDNPIWVFARKETDESFEGLKRNEIVLDPTKSEYQDDINDLLNGTITVDYLSNSLVIFDDTDNLQDKKLLLAIHRLMGDIVTNGRSKGIYCIYITHILMNYQQTRIINNEANKAYFFPGAGVDQIEKFLKTYAHMKPAEIHRITSLKTRWVMLRLDPPRYVIYEKGIFLI